MTKVSAAGQDLCIVQSAGAWYGLPATAIVEVLERQSPVRVPLAPSWASGIIPYRADVLTAVKLAAVLASAPAPEPATPIVLQDKVSGACFALMVDEVHGVARMDEGTREPNPKGLDPLFQAVFDGAYTRAEEFVVCLRVNQLVPENLAPLFDVVRCYSSFQERRTS